MKRHNCKLIPTTRRRNFLTTRGVKEIRLSGRIKDHKIAFSLPGITCFQKQEKTLNWSSYLDSYCKISRAGNKYFNVITFRVTSWFWKSRSYRGITSESQYSFAHTYEKFLLWKAKERKNTAIKTVFNQALRTLTSCLSFSTVIYLFWR